MQKKNLKIGMLGFGSMGKTHTYALKNLPFFYQSLPFSAELYGVCTKTPEKAEYAKNTFGYKLATTNEDELIYSDETDIIDISTPNIFHFESIMKAINAGKSTAKNRSAFHFRKLKKSKEPQGKRASSSEWSLTTDLFLP